MMHKVLIANRGEIACRIMQAAKDLDIETVAIYSDADRHAKHVRMADEAYRVGPSQVDESYLNQTNIIEIALQAGCDAIHPGYGLLSEKADFAKACEQAGLNFIGPKSESIDMLGDKAKAKQLAQSIDIPVIESVLVPDEVTQAWCDDIQSKGQTWLIKACCGGGGRGMRRVTPDDDLAAMIQSARREARNFFDDDGVLLEHLVEPARHIEVQIIADKQGNVRHLFDRDCSVQRRYQKVIEEAPALGIRPDVRQAMFDAAVKLAQAVDYHNVGTVEFLLDAKQNFYFLEMNTRVQVEHPVTEMVCGEDIVKWQFAIADGRELDQPQSAWHTNGVAIEVRLCAEQAEKDFLPSVGRIKDVSFPKSSYIRIDSGFERGDVISPYYDSLLSKIIVWGEDREQALKRMQQALNQTWVDGIQTNRQWLASILADPVFQTGEVSTQYLQNHPQQSKQLSIAKVCALTTLYDYLKTSNQQHAHINWYQQGRWRQQAKPITYQRWLDDQAYSIHVEPTETDTYKVTCNDEAFNLTDCVVDGNSLMCALDGENFHPYIYEQAQTIDVYVNEHAYRLKKYKNKTGAQSHTSDQSLRAPLPGVVVNVLVKEGDRVKAGQTVMVLEAMKMEHPIKAAFDGTVASISAQMDDQVALNTVLAVIQP